MKRKYFLLVSILISVMLIGTAATCNMCGFNLTTDTTAAATTENDSSEVVDETTAETTTIETAIETAAETSAETASESSQEVKLVDISKLTAVVAIANKTGDKLITFYSDANEEGLKGINGAIGEDGKFYKIEYDKKQNSNNQDNGRVTADNFDNMEGYLYNVLENKLISNNTYYLCNSETINKDNLLTTTSTGVEALDGGTKTQIENVKGRSVQEGWIIDKYSDGTQILVVVFEPDGNNLLMSIVLKTGDGIKFMDYPVASDGQSAWRVDDGGKIYPKLFSFLFTAPTKEGLLTVICWAGAEGENVIFLIESADSLNKLPLQISRYWSPV